MELYPTPKASSRSLSDSAPHTVALSGPGVLLTAQLGLSATAFAAGQRLSSSTNKNHRSFLVNKAENEKALGTSTAIMKLTSFPMNQCEDAPKHCETRDDRNEVDPSPRHKRTSEMTTSLPAKKQKTSPSDADEREKGTSMCGEVIVEVMENDVLFGRGGNTNRNPGNIEYRNLVKSKQLRYLETHRLCKGEIAREIVQTIRSRGGRFLKQKVGSSDNLFEDVGDTLARAKTSQALREGLNQRLFFQTQKDGQTMSLSTLDEKSQSAVCKLFRLVPKKRNTCSYEQDRKLMHPIDYNDADAIIPNDADVIYGKGMAIQKHPGNVRFRNIVNMHRSKYQACVRKKQKAAISNDVMRIIKASGGRFLSYENGKYMEVDKHRAKEKVSHALRNRRPYANTVIQQEQKSHSSVIFPTLSTFVLPESCFEPQSSSDTGTLGGNLEKQVTFF